MYKKYIQEIYSYESFVETTIKEGMLLTKHKMPVSCQRKRRGTEAKQKHTGQDLAGVNCMGQIFQATLSFIPRGARFSVFVLTKN